MSSSNRSQDSGRRRNRYFLVDSLTQGLESRAHQPLPSESSNLPVDSSAERQQKAESDSDEISQATLRSPQLEALDAIQSSDFSQRLIRGVIQDIESGIRPDIRKPIDASVLAEEVITLDVEAAEDHADEAAQQSAQATIAVDPEESSEDQDLEVSEPENSESKSYSARSVAEISEDQAQKTIAVEDAATSVVIEEPQDESISDLDLELENDEDFSDVFDNLEALEARAAFDALDVISQQSAPKVAQATVAPPKARSSRLRSQSAAAVADQVFEAAEARENLEAQAAFDALDAIAQQPSFAQDSQASGDSAAQESDTEGLLDDVEAIAAFDALANLAAQQPVEPEVADGFGDSAGPVVSDDPVVAEGPGVQAVSETPAASDAEPAPVSEPDRIPLGFESPETADASEPLPTMIEAPEAPEVSDAVVGDGESGPRVAALENEELEAVVEPRDLSADPIPVTPATVTAPSLSPPVINEPSGVENSPVEFAEPALQPSADLVELDVLSGTQTLEGAIAASDETGSRTYRFSLSQPSGLNLVLEGLSADAEITLMDAQGTVLRTANRDNATSELLGALLNPGDYQVRVSASESTDYRLVLSTTPNIFGTANNLQVSAATYLGGNADDTASAVEFSPQRELIVAGNFGTAAVGGAAERSLLGAGLNGAAQVVRLSASGQEVLSITHLGDTLNDMDVNRATGGIAAVGDFGVAVLNAAADQVLWSQDLGTEVERVAIANDGRVVTLHNKTVTVWSPDGNKLSETTLNRSYVEDVAIDPVSGAIYVAGYDNKYNNVDGNPVQVAFLTGYDDALNTQWSSWGYDADTLTDGQNDMADTRGYRITVGRDGELYFLGEVAGGNSVFRWNGKDRSTETLVKYDAYNDPYNSKSPHQTYYARINPETGEVLQGQLAIARLSNGLSNAVRVFEGSITADEEGNVYIGGRAFSGIDGRDSQTINGEAVGEYTKSDPFALVVSSDFQSRKNWTTFVRDGAQGSINGFAVGEGRAAVVGTIDQGSVITADSALNPNAFNAGDSNLSDVYLATWGTDTVFDDEVLDIGTAVNNFEPGNRLQFSAAELGGDAQTGPISNSAFVLGTQSPTNQSTFLYANGVLSFDGDGSGSQPAFAVATLPGSPNLTAEQISLV